MSRKVHFLAGWSAALFVGALFGAAATSPAWADVLPAAGEAPYSAGAQYRPPPDPTKKKEGEPCQSAAECQPHHQCNKVGDKQVCQAPPPPRLPPGAVT